MTRARITAAQATRPPKGMRMHRGTVTALSPLTVQIAGGGAVTGLAVPGQKYTVGDLVMVTMQEPAVGPVYPLTPTPPPDLSPYAKTTDLAPYAKTTDLSAYAKTTALPATTTGTMAYSGTAADWGTGGSVITRFGPLVSCKLQTNVGATPPGTGVVFATLPTGFRPTGNVYLGAMLWPGNWANQRCDLAIAPDGTISVQSSTVTIPANAGIFASVIFTAA